MTTEDTVLKLMAWLESEEGQAAMKRAAETAKILRAKIEADAKVDPEDLKKKCNI